MTGRFQPKRKLTLVHSSSPMGGQASILVDEDSTQYYVQYNWSNARRISMAKAREMVDQAERECNEVPSRLHGLNEDLVQVLRARTREVPVKPAPPRMTNWGRQVAQHQ